MYKVLKFNEKVRSLLISLEALSLYNLKIFSANSEENLKKGFNTYQEKLDVIYTVYKIIKKQYIQEITIHILNNYNSSYHSNITLQYLKKYKYLHQKNHCYYYMNSYYSNYSNNIEEKAITNLYIINQVYTVKGLYLLIKYLYA